MGKLLPYMALATLRMAREIEPRIIAHRNEVINRRRQTLELSANKERAARWALSAANRYLAAASATCEATKKACGK